MRETAPEIGAEIAWHLTGSLRDDAFESFVRALDEHSDAGVRERLLVDPTQLVMGRKYMQELALFAEASGKLEGLGALVEKRRALVRAAMERAVAKDPESNLAANVRSVMARTGIGPPVPSKPSDR